jgi:hypothetical protein
MNTKSDSPDAHGDLREDARRRLGPPPPVEDVEALLRGDLQGPEAERLREVLAYYPELVRAMTAPFPESAEGVLTEEERAADVESLRRRLDLTTKPPIAFPARTAPSWQMPLAAGIVIALAISGFVLMKRASDQPRPMSTKVLIDDRTRGGGAVVDVVTLDTSTDYVLKPLYRPTRTDREYRLELINIDAKTPETIWRRDNVERRADGSYPINVETKDLRPGRYELVLYGVGDEVRELARYALRIE